jgi:hypothetical protein
MDETTWTGMRWQVDFTPDGHAAAGWQIDATTSEEGHRWALTLQDRLREAGHGVEWGQDEGDDGRGNPTRYDELHVRIGAGSLALSFFADRVHLSVDLFPDECDRDRAAQVARDVRATVEDVTGYRLVASQLLPADLALLGDR